MANARDKNKVSIGFYGTKEEKALLQAAAKKHGFATLTEFLRAVARGAIKVDPKIQALALAAIGTSQQGGCGPLFCLLILAAVAALFIV